MTVSAVVFLGPSLPHDEARAVCPSATFMAPARRGDLARVVIEQRPDVIALIDGLFNTVPAVNHKEILFALARGVRVLGASSMGALRAAELWTFGMEGVGEIFERFRCGEWDADDEVAVVHGPAEAGYRAGSVSLAAIRLALEEAVARGLLHREGAHLIVESVRDVFYPERSWERVLEISRSVGMDEADTAALRAFIQKEAPDAKRADALELLARVRSICESGQPAAPPEAEFDFEPTTFWERLLGEAMAVTRIELNGDQEIASLPELERHVQIQKDGPEIRRGAALLYILNTRQAAARPPESTESIRTALERFRRQRGLESAEAARAWLERQELTQGELSLIARLEVALDALVLEGGGELRQLLALELKRRGEFASARQAIEVKRRALQEMGVTSLGPADLGLSLTELTGWYQDSFETISGDLESHAEALGFDSARAFLNEVALEHRARHGQTH